ncbi:hypothetical protein IFM89_028541 [Coptis chinensis]|uniref:Disease resistance N-terminal domain-containing protein n=1 Tax=Coptis chinensis TaxID=261450 RepID=A0A835M205_9MAGN|nr:hypothetical protein IFM89_028541 [Coptis chinensis]
MAHAVISGALEQLRSILQTEVNLLAGVRNESEKLADTLSLILGVLEDAEEQQVKSGIVKVWLEQITRISYVADDVLDVLCTLDDCWFVRMVLVTKLPPMFCYASCNLLCSVLQLIVMRWSPK